MLAIKGRDDKWKYWHVGDGPLPEVYGPVVTFQADGHELAFIQVSIERQIESGDLYPKGF